MTSPALERYLELLLRLHVMFLQGKQDSDEADHLREMMDDPWYALSDSEMKFVDEISEFLYEEEE